MEVAVSCAWSNPLNEKEKKAEAWLGAEVRGNRLLGLKCTGRFHLPYWGVRGPRPGPEAAQWKPACGRAYTCRMLEYPQLQQGVWRSCFNEMMGQMGAPKAHRADCSLGNYTCPPLSCFPHLFA